MRILTRSSLRYYPRHPWQIGLSILGVALGVAVVIAIDLANVSAKRAFNLSTSVLFGSTTHQIIGGPTGLPESLYTHLRVEEGFRTIAPVVEGYAKAIVHNDRRFQIMGVDIFAENSFRDYTSRIDVKNDVSRLLIEPATAMLSYETAQNLGLVVGDSLALQVLGYRQEVTIIGFIKATDSITQHALESILITDIATAQELLKMIGHLSRIDVIVSDDIHGEPMLDEIRHILPESATIIAANSHSRSMEQMAHAFQLNLTAMSMLALIVGLFLIYNTMTFSVVQRRPLIGTLRAMGVTRREIFFMILSEAIIIGLIGAVVGIVIGILLAHGLVHFVTRTINDLYFLLTVRELSITALTLGKGIALGIGGAVVAALVPALEAIATTPRAALIRSTAETHMRQALPFATLGGIVLCLIGLLLLFIESRSLLLSYASVFIIIVGFVLIIPFITVAMMRTIQPLTGRLFGVMGKMSTRGVVASLSRTGVAIAALTVAVAATISVGIMIGSFRDTLTQWLEHYLRSDIYVTVAGEGNRTLDPGVVDRLVSTSGITTFSTGRYFTIETNGNMTDVIALKLPPQSKAAFDFKQGNPDVIWPAFDHQGAVIVTEPYAYHQRLNVGDRLQLRTDQGEKTFSVAGIFYHYGSDQGIVMMGRQTFEQYWSDRSISSLGLFADAGVDLALLKNELKQRAGNEQQLVIRTNRTLREISLTIFDRTFAITAILRILIIIVAFVAILSALMALQLERAREFAILRANGLTPRQLWVLVTSQTGLMGLTAGILALPLGLVLAFILIYVVNLRSFGWTMQLAIEPGILIQALLLAFIAAILAGIYPAYKMARTSPALALREE